MSKFMCLSIILCIACSSPDDFTEEDQWDSGVDTQTETNNDTEYSKDTETDTETDTTIDTDTELQKFGNPCGNNPWRCDPITNEGCNSGSLCDWGFDVRTLVQGFYCFEVDNRENSLGEDCNLQDGPFCAAGLTCAQEDIGSPIGTCRAYCCGDDECGEDFKCMSTFLNIWRIYITGGEFGVCLPEGTPFFPF